MTHRIATVINFCSNEYPFLGHCVQQVKKFSKQIIIPTCDHFFDGIPEDRDLLRRIYREHPDCLFIEFEFNPEQNECGPKNSQFWHNLSRLLGLYFVDKDIDYILFIDCDEIFDADAFMQWLHVFPYVEYEAMQLACYWYFRKECYQAAKWEDTPVFVKKSGIVIDMLMDPLERGSIYSQTQGDKLRHVLGVDQRPMCHHYSWVRTKEQMLRKVLSWSHRTERDWKRLVEEEFERPFNGRDFVHGYECVAVEPFVEIDLYKEPLNFQVEEAKNVRFINTEKIHKIDLSLRFDICT
jgi:hypothetical protein